MTREEVKAARKQAWKDAKDIARKEGRMLWGQPVVRMSDVKHIPDADE